MREPRVLALCLLLGLAPTGLPAAARAEADEHLRAGLVARQARRLSTALDELLLAVRIDPGLAEAQWELGRTAAELQFPAVAIPAFQAVLRLAPDTVHSREATAAIDRLVRVGQLSWGRPVVTPLEDDDEADPGSGEVLRPDRKVTVAGRQVRVRRAGEPERVLQLPGEAKGGLVFASGVCGLAVMERGFALFNVQTGAVQPVALSGAALYHPAGSCCPPWYYQTVVGQPSTVLGLKCSDGWTVGAVREADLAWQPLLRDWSPSGVEVSPDGRYLAIHQTQQDAAKSHQAALVDGRVIDFASLPAGPKYSWPRFVVDLVSPAPPRLVHCGGPTTWTADGRRLLLWGSSGLSIARPDGGEARALVPEPIDSLRVLTGARVVAVTRTEILHCDASAGSVLHRVKLPAELATEGMIEWHGGWLSRSVPVAGGPGTGRTTYREEPTVVNLATGATLRRRRVNPVDDGLPVDWDVLGRTYLTGEVNGTAVWVRADPPAVLMPVAEADRPVVSPDGALVAFALGSRTEKGFKATGRVVVMSADGAVRLPPIDTGAVDDQQGVPFAVEWTSDARAVVTFSDDPQHKGGVLRHAWPIERR